MNYQLKTLGCIVLIAGSLSAMLQGCSAPAQALRPIAQQNASNMAALSTNVRTLLSLYEPLLNSASATLLQQIIGKTRQEMIAVVGPPMLPPPAVKDWETLFQQASATPTGKRDQYLDRYQLAKSSRVVLSEKDQIGLLSTTGWIYQTITDDSLTPQKVHALLKELSTLKESKADGDFFKQAEAILLPYDPRLRYYRDVVDGAKQLLDGLKEEIQQELSIAAVHSQSIAGYANATVEVSEIARLFTQQFGPTDATAVLNALGKKYILDERTRDAAISLLFKGIHKITGINL